MRVLLAATVALNLGGISAASATVLPRYEIRATVTRLPPRIAGNVTIHFANSTDHLLDHAVLFLFPNRFSGPELDTGVNDFNRPFVYPEQEFDPGGLRIEVRDASAANSDLLPQQPVQAAHLCAGCAVRVPLLPPLPPGEFRTLSIDFQTTIPYRFGSFGWFDEQLTLAGGWHPMLATLGGGGWETDSHPPAAQFEVHLDFPESPHVILNGIEAVHTRHLDTEIDHAHFLTLIAASHFERRTTEVGRTRIELLTPPARRFSRVSGQADPPEQLLETLADAVRHAPAALGTPPDSLLVVQAPLRMQLVAPAEGMLVVSDRAIKVHYLLRPYHERHIARAIYQEWLHRDPQRRRDDDDRWVTRGTAQTLADRYMGQRPPVRSVQEWIDQFNTFAIVDRFETAPRIPFVDTFFEKRTEDDELHEQIDSFNNDLPPGDVVFNKLKDSLGEARFGEILDSYLKGKEPFRIHLRRSCGDPCLRQAEQWLSPYPLINYSLEDVERNEPSESGYRQSFTLRRESSRPVSEPVDVSLRSLGGEIVRVRWTGEGDAKRFAIDTRERVFRIELDPSRRLIETTRADNAHLAEIQFVIDSAEMEVTSTEFGFAALGVVRQRYDYRKDFGIAALYSDRGIGVAVGPRLHWGIPVDANTYRHNFFGYYTITALDGSFDDKSRPGVRTRGHSNGIGFRYDYSTVYGYDNPTDTVRFRMFGDWFDTAMGSTYDYADWGVAATITTPIRTPRTVLAFDTLNGFSRPLGNSVVPLQGQFSLGGSRSIRGIGAQEELRRNIFLLRAEIRRSLYPEVDLNMLDMAVIRRWQIRLFVDAGQVSNSAGAVYDPRRYAVGVGTGIAFTYEVFGFFPAQAYLEVATRVDRTDSLKDVQVLFGSRQAF